MASHPASAARGLRETDSSAFYKVAAMLLGLTLAVVSLFALFLWSDARS